MARFFPPDADKIPELLLTLGGKTGMLLLTNLITKELR